ncbi:MAG: hypothetical protein QGI81_11040 [Pseudomonadales bacterium]|jgi:membrane protein implicated in regulation of membrane protease activity|nr:hypothetical protein [Pseudomonadales bacterium]|tara:strand:+ start:640 stop:873 length:234 start_codon:yes stop_codon:yes gene_type:complete
MQTTQQTVDKQTRETIIGDSRQLLFMLTGAVAGTVLGLVFLNGRANIVLATVICMALGQFLNRYLRRRERKAQERNQ